MHLKTHFMYECTSVIIRAFQNFFLKNEQDPLKALLSDSLRDKAQVIAFLSLRLIRTKPVNSGKSANDFN